MSNRIKKAGLILFFLMIFSTGGCGSAESVGYFLGGMETGVQLAKKTADEINIKVEEANDVSNQLDSVMTSAKSIIENADPNQLALVAELIKQDPNQVQTIVTGMIETYNQTHGTVAILKEKSREPGYWVALAMALIAAYQKYQRSKKA